MSATLPEGTIHLVAVDDALSEYYRYRSYMTVCGELVSASSLPPSLCPGECTSEHRYCPVCVREAARWSVETGDRASGADHVATR